MNKQLVAILSVLVLLFAVGCQKQAAAPAPQPAPAPAVAPTPAPQPAPAPAPVPAEKPAAEEKGEPVPAEIPVATVTPSDDRKDLGGNVGTGVKVESDYITTETTVSGEGFDYIGSLSCEMTDGKGTLTWELKNPTEKDYIISKVSPLTGGNALRVSMNGRVVKDASAVCGSEDGVLKAGSSVSCSLEVAKETLATGYMVRTTVTGLGAQNTANNLDVLTPESRQHVDFKCNEGAVAEAAETAVNSSAE